MLTAAEIKTIADNLNAMAAVTGTKEWQGKRTYVQVAGTNRSIGGDTSYGLFVDHANGELVVTRGKGTCSRTFVDNLRAIVAAYHGKVRKEAFGPADEGFSFIANT